MSKKPKHRLRPPRDPPSKQHGYAAVTCWVIAVVFAGMSFLDIAGSFGQYGHLHSFRPALVLMALCSVTIAVIQTWRYWHLK